MDILRQASPDILIATHSTEIISEADPGEIIVINKKGPSAKRIKSPTQLQEIFSVLGSNLNPILTQLAKSRRVVFVEGKDFKILSAFARKLGKNALANRTDFAVVPVEGFNTERVNNFSEGMELTLGTSILKSVIFDRDYRPKEEVCKIIKDFSKFTKFIHIHERKEIENYLFEQNAICRAVYRRVLERSNRIGKPINIDIKVSDIITRLCEKLKNNVNAQFMARGTKYIKSSDPHLDISTINKRMLDEFDGLWSSLDSRLNIVPGKELLSCLNEELQLRFSITLTYNNIISAMSKEEIPREIIVLIDELEIFRNSKL